ncbi:MAG: MFS transporter [Eggerthellaceae bacterium]|nr:MFS transporter [Eggerthellaceae bacterium]
MDKGGSQKRLGAILAIYLVGLLVGGLYVGMVAPVRTVVQASFGLDDATGIWMINIYTLFYAALIPVIGKLADRYGRKPTFVICVISFAVGSMLCGTSLHLGGFSVLLVGRVVQAVGACGMIPVANAEIGTSFPKERRGMALGLAAAVTGLSNVFGAACGSGLLALFGNDGWPWMFFVCVPVCVLLGIAAAFLLPKREGEVSEDALDIPGAIVFVVMVLLLLLSFRSIDFFDAKSFVSFDVIIPFAGALIGIVIFAIIERRAQDPIFHLEYLKDRQILATCGVSFFIGCMIISMTLVPEFAEHLLDLPIGSGGYYVAAIGIFSLFGPVIAGKLIDRLGPKKPLMGGLFIAALGFLFVAFFVTEHPSSLLLIIGLSVIGLGMGLSMGAPTNYMILESTSEGESTVAIATITLIRQIGTTLSPALLVGFITSGIGMTGFSHMMCCVAVFCMISMIILCFYRSKG